MGMKSSVSSDFDDDDDDLDDDDYLNDNDDLDDDDYLNDNDDLNDDDDDGSENNCNNSIESLNEDDKIPDCTHGCNVGDLTEFTYEAERIYTEGHAIRLLRLMRGSGQIQGCIFKAFLHQTGEGLNGMPYDALSYTWGSPEVTEQIILDGKRFKVTKNLHLALQYLRSADEDRILWIDAICINQEETPERNHQVKHMASIYRDAERVIFWLGEPTCQTDSLISSLRILQKCARYYENPDITQGNAHDRRWRELWNNHEFNDDFKNLREGLILLLERPWFNRSWILQEVCFAKSGIVVCGSQTIAAHIFALGPWLLDHNLEPHCEAVLQMMPGATRSTRKFLSGRELRNLYSLLRRFYRSEAGDPRDQVYALLNMATDADMTGFPEAKYEKQFEEVIDSVFAYLFPKSWDRRGKSHDYPSLSVFVEDFPDLRRAEMEAGSDDQFLQARLSDDTEFSGRHLQEVLHTVIRTGNTLLLQDLLRMQIDVNLKDEYQRTPLSHAAKNGHKAAVKILLDADNVDVDLADEKQRTPLFWAAMNGHEAVVELLLDKGADVNVQGKYRSNALQAALFKGHEQIVKLLLEKGADVNMQDGDYSNALYRASSQGYE